MFRKIIVSTTFVFLALGLFSCYTYKYGDFSVDGNQVETISIKKSSENEAVFLSDLQARELFVGLNNNKKVGPAKFIVLYHIDIKLKNDSAISLKCGQSYFYIENNSKCYKIKSFNFIEDFWKKLEEK
ncbi:MAG: hypothetical protein GX102_05620 [Porphyromonadaceae bacterium]|jgi:hypothetical protein|nr:hypothetical protein [Porphyromonadaceae bacterium]